MTRWLCHGWKPHAWGKWEQKTQRFSREPRPGDSGYVAGTKVVFDEEWQERRCEKCGLVERTAQASVSHELVFKVILLMWAFLFLAGFFFLRGGQ